MSQNDFVLSNQGFASMRADLNSALAALATNSSGATGPATTYAYQWWYDTTANMLKMRNAANTAWISMFTFDQTGGLWWIDGNLTLVNNIVHHNDANTYIGFPADDRIAMVAGGVDNMRLSPTFAVFNDGGAEVDFRVKSNTFTNAFFVAGGTGAVTMGAKSLTVGAPNTASNSGDGATLTSGLIVQEPSTAGDTTPVIRAYKGTTVNFRVEASGRTLIPWAHTNTTASAANVQIDSDGILRRSTSSGRYKTDIQPATITASESIVYNSVPVSYRSLSEADDPDALWWGFIAEQVAEEVDQSLVLWSPDENGNLRPDGVFYDRYAVHLCNVARAQRDRIEALEARIAALEAAA
jgi:hypothetical protein